MNTFGFVLIGLLLFANIVGWPVVYLLDRHTTREIERRRKRQLYGDWHNKCRRHEIQRSDVSVTPSGQLSQSIKPHSP